MKEYTFHSISELEKRENHKRTILTVKENRLDELRPYSKIISSQEWELMETKPRYSEPEYFRLQGMLSIYEEIIRQGEFEERDVTR